MADKPVAGSSNSCAECSRLRRELWLLKNTAKQYSGELADEVARLCVRALLGTSDETPAVPFGASSHRFAIECEGCKRGVTITLGQGVVLGYQCSCGHYTKLRDAEKASEHLDPLCNCPVDSWGIVRCQEDSGIVRCRAEVNAENGPEQR